MVSVTPSPLFTPGKDPIPSVQEAGWAPGPVWTGAENLAPTGIRSPDRPARSQSLYRLRYLACSIPEKGCVVSAETRIRAGDLRIRCEDAGKARGFLLYKSVETGYGTHPTPYSVGPREFLVGDKAAGC